MAWRFVLTDLAGNPLSELPGVDGRTVALPIRSTSTGAFQIDLRRSEADALTECATLLKVYEDRPDPDQPGRTKPYLHAHLQQVTGTEDGNAGKSTMTATFADPSWDLAKRLIGKSSSGYAKGTALTLVDRGTIIADMIATTAAEAPLRLRMGTVTASSSTYVRDWFYKPILEAMTELSATLDGPDWRVRPVEYSNGIIGELDVVPAIGQRQTEAIFEYGSGLRNVSNYSRVVTRDTQANQAYSLPTGFPDPTGGAVLAANDPAAIAKWGLLEALVPTDLGVDQLRQQLLWRHIALRANPRQTINFSPASSLNNVPLLGSGYNVGDLVTFRATVNRDGVDVPRVNAWFRAYQASISVSALGTATTSLTISPDAGGVS